jgi:hypothetical protein
MFIAIIYLNNSELYFSKSCVALSSNPKADNQVWVTSSEKVGAVKRLLEKQKNAFINQCHSSIHFTAILFLLP